MFTTHLFQAAKLSGTMLQTAAVQAAHDICISEDKEMLLQVNTRRLSIELRKTEQSLVDITNWGPSYPVKEHAELTERRDLIKFLINPSAFQGQASLC